MRNQKIIFKNPNRPASAYTSHVDSAQFICSMHFHPELEFLYVLSGVLKLTTENQEYILQSGDIIFINSNTPHQTESLAAHTRFCLAQFRRPSLIKSSLKYLSDFLMDSNVSVYVFKENDPDHKELSGALLKMNEENKNQDLAYDYYITASIYSIIALLYRRNFLSTENLNERSQIEKIVPVIEYIDENYMMNISLESLAKTVNLNKDYLCRLFKKATNKTISDYINLVRVSNAEELLKKNLNVTEAAYNVGFSSLSYFNTIFRKYKHFSPSIYKKIYSGRDMTGSDGYDNDKYSL